MTSVALCSFNYVNYLSTALFIYVDIMSASLACLCKLSVWLSEPPEIPTCLFRHAITCLDIQSASRVMLLTCLATLALYLYVIYLSRHISTCPDNFSAKYRMSFLKCISKLQTYTGCGKS